MRVKEVRIQAGTPTVFVGLEAGLDEQFQNPVGVVAIAKARPEVRLPAERPSGGLIPASQQTNLGGVEELRLGKPANSVSPADKAKQGLQAILSEYGIIIENVALMDYRFNADYQAIITNKKIADTKTKTLISEKDSTMEMNKKLLQDAQAEVNKAIAQADGQYQEAMLAADAYYQQQTNLAAATIAEGTAEAASIKKMREAMTNEGGLIQVKMAIADSLRNKRIVMIPTGSANSFNLQTLDINEILKQLGVIQAK